MTPWGFGFLIKSVMKIKIIRKYGDCKIANSENHEEVLETIHEWLEKEARTGGVSPSSQADYYLLEVLKH